MSGGWLISAALIVAACADSGSETKTVALELSDAGLSPNNVTVSVGQPVELSVHNRTGAAHGLAIADIPVAMSGSGERNMAGMSGMSGDGQYTPNTSDGCRGRAPVAYIHSQQVGAV